MEDFNDNLPTIGKRYYMSHSEYFYTEKHYDKLTKLGFEIDRYEPMKLSQLVCASNMDNARFAVKKSLEKSGEFSVTKCRIDNLIVGD